MRETKYRVRVIRRALVVFVGAIICGALVVYLFYPNDLVLTMVGLIVACITAAVASVIGAQFPFRPKFDKKSHDSA